MDRIDIAPEGEIAVGTLTDAEGIRYACIDVSEGESDRTVRLYFRLEHFVAFADHMRSVADEIVEAHRPAPDEPPRA